MTAHAASDSPLFRYPAFDADTANDSPVFRPGLNQLLTDAAGLLPPFSAKDSLALDLTGIDFRLGLRVLLVLHCDQKSATENPVFRELGFCAVPVTRVPETRT